MTFLYSNIILGLKSDKTTLGLINELNKIQGINTSIYNTVDDKVPMRRYYNTKFPSDEIIEIKKDPEFDPNVLKQDFISFNRTQGNMEEEDDETEFRLNRDEMSEKEANLLEKTREYNKKLEENPFDPLLWIDFVSFQDKYHQGMVGRASHSVRF